MSAYEPEVMSQGALDVMAERQRQKEVEGWTPAHDDGHSDGQMAVAAACYAVPRSEAQAKWVPADWPWHPKWWKPKDRRRDLVRAAALLVAEIERMDRATSLNGSEKL